MQARVYPRRSSRTWAVSAFYPAPHGRRSQRQGDREVREGDQKRERVRRPRSSRLSRVRRYGLHLRAAKQDDLSACAGEGHETCETAVPEDRHRQNSLEAAVDKGCELFYSGTLAGDDRANLTGSRPSVAVRCDGRFAQRVPRCLFRQHECRVRTFCCSSARAKERSPTSARETSSRQLLPDADRPRRRRA